MQYEYSKESTTEGTPMEFTSASANKFLRRLQDEKDYILRTESETSTYIRAEDEAIDPPLYNYAETREKVAALDKKVLTLRHALHRFNIETLLPNCGLTIDEALIALAQLSARRDRVNTLRSRQPKERLRDRYFGNGAGAVEYQYANYDVREAEQDYNALTEEISAIQLELDLANQTRTFEVDIDL